DCLFGGNADQALAGAHIGWAPRPRLAAVVLRRDFGRRAPRQEFRHLWRLLEAGVQEPQRLATNPQTLLVGIADIAKSGVSEAVGAGGRQSGLAAGFAIRV